MKTLDLPMYRSYLWNILACSKGMKITWSMLGIAKISIATQKDAPRWKSWFFIATDARLEDVDFARALLSSVITMFRGVILIILVNCLSVLLLGKGWPCKLCLTRPSMTLGISLIIARKRNCRCNWTQSTTKLLGVKDTPWRKSKSDQKSWIWTKIKRYIFFIDPWHQKPRKLRLQTGHIYHKILEKTSINFLMILSRSEIIWTLKKIRKCNLWQNLTAAKS